MRIDHLLDPAQANAQQYHRVIQPPATAPPRRVQAINRQAAPDDPRGVGTAPPDDGITLDLSPEGRQAARQAALEEMAANASQKTSNPPVPGDPTREPSPEEMRNEQTIRELAERDRRVRARQQATATAVGSLAPASASYTYQMGPDGRLYAVDGETPIDTTPVPGDPVATLRKAQQIEQAVFAPGESSPSDRRAAALAAAMAAKARQELARLNAEKSAAAAAEAAPTTPRSR
jgi:hypothetical protein